MGGELGFQNTLFSSVDSDFSLSLPSCSNFRINVLRNHVSNQHNLLFM